MIYDVVIVGGGPAGFSASLAAMQHKLRSVTIEQDSFGGTVAHYPRGKLVMTAPATLPLIGTVKFREVSKEKLLAFWHKAAERTGLRINYGERVENVKWRGTEFAVTSTRGRYLTRSTISLSSLAQAMKLRSISIRRICPPCRAAGSS